MIEIVEYLTDGGKSPFKEWFNQLNAKIAARITTALTRIEQGLLTDVKSVGQGVQEYRIHTGPGFRLYFGREGNKVIVLLAGGTKKRQQTDIRQAQIYWRDYQQRKIEET